MLLYNMFDLITDIEKYVLFEGKLSEQIYTTYIVLLSLEILKHMLLLRRTDFYAKDVCKPNQHFHVYE